MSFFAHSFIAPLSPHNVGSYGYKVVWLPAEIAARLPLADNPRLRITGEVADVPIEGAWQPFGGRHYLMIGPAICRAAGLSLGDAVEVRFSIADQDAVQVPDALEEALAGDAATSRAWDALSPGRRRALCHHVGAARTEATREKRVATVLDLLADPDALRRFFRKG